MANMTAATDEQMNSRLKKDYDAKKNNLTSYYKQLHGKSNDAASVGSGSSASANSYSSYLSNANEKLKKQQRKTEITLRLIIVFALAADISRRHDKHEGVIRPDAFRNRDKIKFNICCLRLPQRQQVC